jgi:hypothetical protein
MRRIVIEVDPPHENEMWNDLDRSQKREREVGARVERDTTEDIGIDQYPPPKMRRRPNDAENVVESDAAAEKRTTSTMNALSMKSKKIREIL